MWAHRLVIGLALILSSTCGCDPNGAHPIRAEWYQEAIRLAMGIEAFHDQFGSYPPNFADRASVERWNMETFPDADPETRPPEHLDAAQALVFCLTQIGKDQHHPFARDAPDSERYIFAELVPDRIRGGRYYPARCDEPYVLFIATQYGKVDYHGFEPYFRMLKAGDTANANGTSALRRSYFHPDSCQVIAAGHDGKLGKGGDLFLLDPDDEDNITNINKREIGDLAEQMRE